MNQDQKNAWSVPAPLPKSTTTMATNDSHSNLSARGCRLNLGLRIAVLVLDFITIVSLLVSIGLYHTWIPRISYPTTALKPAKHTDWTDPVVLAAVLLSFIWTSFITMRPAWTSKVLHQGFYIVIEFTCLASLLACTISAFRWRDSVFENIVAISNTCDQGTETLMTGQHVPWVCMPHINTLKRLQIAGYSVACIIA